MKRELLLVMSAILLITIVSGIAISAQGNGWEYYACGTVDGYEDAPSASIDTPGFWNLKVQGDKIWLDVRYLETNVMSGMEGSPEGSVDILESSMTGKPMVFIESEDKLEIFAVMRITKTWAQFDDTYKPQSWKTWIWFTFDFDAMTVHMDGYPGEAIEPPGPADPNDIDTYDWDRYGTITAYSYPGPS